MIARLQKTRLLAAALLRSLQGGRFPQIDEAAARVAGDLDGRPLGAPLARLRAAVPGYPVGGPDGEDIHRSLTELQDDLRLLYQAALLLGTKTVDVYDIFGVRRDRLAAKLAQLKLQTETLLAQVAAGSRASVTDSFNTLDQVDLTRTTAYLNLQEGVCTLPPDPRSSVQYDGSKARLIRQSVPAGGQEQGPGFAAVFSPYRLDAWYATLPAGGVYEAVVTATGADYEQGGTDEILLNALRVEPTGPTRLQVDWSPDGFNWHALSPPVAERVDDARTFHFDPVRVGYLRFRLSRPQGTAGTVGVKRVELLRRGTTDSAQLYSVEYPFTEPVHTLVAELQARTPLGTRVQCYAAQAHDGPWVPLGPGPVTFDTIQQVEVRIPDAVEEQTANPATFWTYLLPSGTKPLPNTGELRAGDEQLHISAFRFDWQLKGETDHLPTAEDWENPLGEVRGGTFDPLPGGLGSADITLTAFKDAKNPLTTDTRAGSYMVFALAEGNAERILQPAHNYRIRAYLRTLAPITLENQRIGVVNEGGTPGLTIAPVTVYLNGRKVFQKKTATDHVSGLAAADFQTTLALQSGWNELEILVQVPASFTPGAGGVASGNVYLYAQPNLYAEDRADTQGIVEVRAYQDPWPRKSEFDLRYNTPVGAREAWAWKQDLSTNEYLAVLFNHDPFNSATRAAVHPSYQTLDSLLTPYPVTLFLRYPVERADGQGRSLWFRADLSQEPGATAPPSLDSYRLIVN